MSRSELLDLLYEQEKRLEELEKENEELKLEIEDRKIRISKVGSIAEASLALTKVFDEAQKAVDRYLDNVQGIVREKQTANYVFPAKQVKEGGKMLGGLGQGVGDLVDGAVLPGGHILGARIVVLAQVVGLTLQKVQVQQTKPVQKVPEKPAYVGRHSKAAGGGKK